MRIYRLYLDIITWERCINPRGKNRVFPWCLNKSTRNKLSSDTLLYKQIPKQQIIARQFLKTQDFDWYLDVFVGSEVSCICCYTVHVRSKGMKFCYLFLPYFTVCALNCQENVGLGNPNVLQGIMIQNSWRFTVGFFCPMWD